MYSDKRSKPRVGDKPSLSNEGYNQTYIIRKTINERMRARLGDSIVKNNERKYDEKYEEKLSKSTLSDSSDSDVYESDSDSDNDVKERGRNRRKKLLNKKKKKKLNNKNIINITNDTIKMNENIDINGPDDDGLEGGERHVFFRCGNWCYEGIVNFEYSLDMENESFALNHIPILIPTLQRQQGKLHYICPSDNIPQNLVYSRPINFFHDALNFLATELMTEEVQNELEKWSKLFGWLENDDNNNETYFELNCLIPTYLEEEVALLASKTYTRGLIIISVYFENSFYFVVRDGSGDQPLLDVRFPDLSQHGQGLVINTYPGNNSPWLKLTLWHSLSTIDNQPITKPIKAVQSLSFASDRYIQTYCVFKSVNNKNKKKHNINNFLNMVNNSNHSMDEYSTTPEASNYEVLFRFGSWCYKGMVQLSPKLKLNDIPYVIPALRLQQGKLDYFCDVSDFPSNSAFSSPMNYLNKIIPVIEELIINSDEKLTQLCSRLNAMGLGESITNWLEGDSMDSFFEFQLVLTDEIEKFNDNLELMATKMYTPSGVIIIAVYFNKTIYVILSDGEKEQPLLDSRFPDVSTKGRGYQISVHPKGLKQWPELRRFSIWQTSKALEKELQKRKEKIIKAREAGGHQFVKMVESEDKKNQEVFEKELENDNNNNDDINTNHSIAETKTPLDRSQSLTLSSKSNKIEEPLKRTNSTSTNISSIRNVYDLSSMNNDLDDLYDFGDNNNNNNNLYNKTKSEKKEENKINDNKIIPQEKSDDKIITKRNTNNINNNHHHSNQPRKKINPMASKVALPHHIAPMDGGLREQLESIRKEMGNNNGLAPWDSRGRPLMSTSSEKKKKKKKKDKKKKKVK